MPDELSGHVSEGQYVVKKTTPGGDAGMENVKQSVKPAKNPKYLIEQESAEDTALKNLKVDVKPAAILHNSPAQGSKGDGATENLQDNVPDGAASLENLKQDVKPTEYSRKIPKYLPGPRSVGGAAMMNLKQVVPDEFAGYALAGDIVRTRITKMTPAEFYKRYLPK